MSSNSKKYIEIKPKSKLEYYFWTDPYRLPKDEETLKKFERKHIKFVIALGKHTMNTKCYTKIQRLKRNNIGFNVCILDKDFAHLDNSRNFIDLYKILRKSNIFNDIEEIYIDAEISNKYKRNIRTSVWNKKLAYIYKNSPTKSEFQKAIEDYSRLEKLIHKDSKKFGIIRSITTTYEVDKLTRNVPFNHLHEDLTVIMTYRVPEGRPKEYNDYWFYQVAKKEGENIFLGAVRENYQSLKKDITICSFLRKKRVYIYDYNGFKKFCKIGDLKPYKQCKIKRDPLESIKHLTKFTGIEIADKFLRFFK